jgi:hypothetical protein
MGLVVLWARLAPAPKKARQEIWLNAHAQQIQDKQMRRVYEKAAHAPASVDRDAFERENRRWD